MNEIRLALTYYKEHKRFPEMYDKHLLTLIKLAEKYLAVNGMPKKESPAKVAEKGWSFEEQVGRNQAIEDCTLVATRLVAEKEKEMGEKHIEQCKNCGELNAAAITIIDNIAEIEALKEELDSKQDMIKTFCGLLVEKLKEIKALKKELAELKGESNG